MQVKIIFSAGELDDTKLIEGITGEKSIYKQRGEQDPEPGAQQEKPKRLRLVVDVSGSMYRFNGKTLHTVLFSYKGPPAERRKRDKRYCFLKNCASKIPLHSGLGPGHNYFRFFFFSLKT
jgi:hypothetical protein